MNVGRIGWGVDVLRRYGMRRRMQWVPLVAYYFQWFSGSARAKEKPKLGVLFPLAIFKKSMTKEMDEK